MSIVLRLAFHIACLIVCLVAAPAFVLAETTAPCSWLRHVALWLYTGLISVLLAALVLTFLPWQPPLAAAVFPSFLCLVALDLLVCWSGRHNRRPYPERSQE